MKNNNGKPWYEKISIWITIIAGICAILGISMFGGISFINSAINQKTNSNITSDEDDIQPEEMDDVSQDVSDNVDETIKEMASLLDSIQSENDQLKSENDQLKSENDQLKDENDQLKDENDQLQNQIDELNSKQNNIPNIKYKDLGLSIDGEDIPINRSNSMVIIDGKEYISKEIADKLISENQDVTITDDTIFIGKVVADAENLFTSDKYLYDLSPVHLETNYDSSKNEYPNSYSLTHNSFVEYDLNNKFSYLDITYVLSKNANRDRKGHITVMADEKVIYTSPSFDKEDEAFREKGIPINKCDHLIIKYEQDNLYDYIPCIISDAIVYN